MNIIWDPSALLAALATSGAHAFNFGEALEKLNA